MDYSVLIGLVVIAIVGALVTIVADAIAGLITGIAAEVLIIGLLEARSRKIIWIDR